MDFCLFDDNTETICLRQFLGQWVVLYFYPKDATPGCTLEARDFTTLIEEFEKRNAVVLAVSPDSLKSHCSFRDKHNLKVRLLSDPDHEALQKFGVWVQKTLFGKKRWDVERSTFLISPEGAIVHQWRKVSVPGHARDVLNVLISKTN